MEKRIWISWETQRRSVEFSKRLGCEHYIIEEKGKLRYPKSIIKTLHILSNTKPDILFVQNPSMILAAVSCIYGFICKTPVVIDRHTTFLISRKYPLSLWLVIFKLLHWFTIRCANLTIVTNDFLAGIVWQLGGRPFVLPDKLPELSFTSKLSLKGKINIFMISSFGKDEPIASVLQAMKAFEQENVVLYISGNHSKLDKSLLDKSPDNVVFTGFISDNEFANMIFSVDAIMVLTTSDYCMLCGCYESVSAEKPLITSNKKVLKDYFKGAVFVKNDTSGIIDGVRVVLSNLDQHRKTMKELKTAMTSQWEEEYLSLEAILKDISR